MDRATIKALATAMLQNRSSAGPTYLDQMIDLTYGHTLVDVVPSFGRRGIELITTAIGVDTYTLSDLFRAIDADYAYRDAGELGIPIYTSQEVWMQQSPDAGTNPVRVLVYYDQPNWVAQISPEPADIYDLSIPATFYRSALPTSGTPNENEAMAVMYGAVLQIALVSGLDEVVTAATAGFNTMVGLLRSQYASERAAYTQLPARRDF